jgi:hypothetical protein
MVAKTTASAIQKENFKTRFAEIIKNNSKLKDQYSIQFFDTAQKSNYVIYGLNGKTINILEGLTLEETEKYKNLKLNWQS